MAQNEDPWLALDKLYHLLFCFILTVLFATVADLSRRPLLRRYSVGIGSVASLLAGAAKEAADEFGFFKSGGASAKDAVADAVGVLIAALGLLMVKMRSQPGRDSDPTRIVSGISLV